MTTDDTARVTAGPEAAFPSCPVCGGRRRAPYRTIGEWLLDRCTECDLVRLVGDDGASEVSDLYSDPDYFQQRIQKGMPSREEAEARARSLLPAIRRLEARLGRKGRLLEIGCGYGFLLAAARMDGWEVAGVDISPHAAQTASRLFGLDVAVGEAEALGSLGVGSFDAAMMLSVIEHLQDPATALKAVRQALEPEGVLWAVVPNLGSLDRYWHGRAWSGWDLPYHRWHFSHRTIRRLLGRVGFGAVAIENTFFDPVRHLRAALGPGGRGRDVRDLRPRASEAPVSSSPGAKRRSSGSAAGWAKRAVKRVFSERDMQVWAR